MKNNTFQEIWEKLREAKNILIPLHPRPDGDSLGSCTALKYVLEKNTNTKITLISKDELADDIAAFDFSKEVEFGKNLEDYKLEDFDALVFIDHGSLQGYSEKIQNNKFPENLLVIKIDHHQTNSYSGDMNYIDTKRVSCCSILFEFFQKIGIKFDGVLARRLFLGICTDSYFFINGDDTLDAMKKSIFLIETGKIDYLREFYQPLTGKTWRLKKMEAVLLANMQKTEIEGKTVVYSFVEEEEVKKYGLNIAEVRLGIVFLKDIKDVDLFITLTDVDDGVKGSFRSWNIDTSLFSEKLGGGGHKGSSSFMLEKMPMEKAIEITLETIKEIGMHPI